VADTLGNLAGCGMNVVGCSLWAAHALVWVAQHDVVCLLGPHAVSELCRAFAAAQ